MNKGKNISVLVSMTLIALIIMFSGFMVQAGAYAVPDTGQTKCYGTTGTEISCAGTGQDGEYSINHMTYTDNGNGTVTDNVTGLMWQKEDDNKDYNPYLASGTYHAYYNPSSQSVCGSLSLGGYSDWRLPTIKELIDLTDFGIPFSGVSINSTYFPNTKGGGNEYWSSTINNGAEDYGAYTGTSKWQSYGYGDGIGSSYRYVRCVRGAQSSPSFTKNGDGTVTDNVTGLMWQSEGYGTGYHDSDGQYYTTSYVDWTGALTYCKNLNLGSQTGWRLPNIKELVSIVDFSYSIPTSILDSIYYTTYFTNNAISFFSSTTDSSNTINNLGINGGRSTLSYFKTGIAQIDTGPKLTNGQNYDYVRCVRGGQSGSTQNNCAATISSSLVIHIPILTYSNANYWVDLQFNSANSTLTLANAGMVSDTSSYSNCTPSTLSADFKLHIPALIYAGITYQMDLQWNGAGFVITGIAKN